MRMYEYQAKWHVEMINIECPQYGKSDRDF